MSSIISVTSAATVTDLTTTAAVKAELGITGSSEDTQIAAYIKRATAKIAMECRRAFASERVTETFRLSISRPSLVLSRFPVTVVTSVTVDGTILPSAEYEIDKERGILYRLDDDGDRINWECDPILIDYTGGYDLNAARPADLEGACISLVKQYRISASRDPMAKRIEIPGVRTTDFWVGSMPGQGDLPLDVESVIEAYKVYRL